MKQGLNLVQLAQEILRQKDLKQDLVAPQAALSMNDATQLVLQDQSYRIRPHAHGQIAGRLNIPQKYYNRMLETAPDLLAANVNRWFAEGNDRRMVRTMGGEVRAILSDRYQRIENEEIAEIAIPALQSQPDMFVESCQITETRLYIKAVFPRVQGEVKVGDVMQSGVVISNSEVGAGALSVTPLLYRLVCKNGAIIPDARFRAYHLGSKLVESDEVYALLSDETRQADDKALLLKVRDVVKSAADSVFFNAQLDKMREAAGQKIEGDPIKAVTILSKKLLLTEVEQGSVLRHLIEGGDISRWGVLNAVTRAAQDVESYDRSTELEMMGGTILNLAASEWKEIARAA